MDQQAPSPWSMVLDAISQLRQDVTHQFTTMSARLDKFVTTDAHQADIKRLEDRHSDLIADVGREQLLRAEMRAELTEQIKGLTEALKEERAARISGQRWGIGTLIAAVAAASAVIGLVLR